MRICQRRRNNAPRKAAGRALRTRLETSDDIRALIGRIVVAPGASEDGSVALRLEGDLGGILTLEAGEKTRAHREDERVLTSVVAGARNHRYRHSIEVPV